MKILKAISFGEYILDGRYFSVKVLRTRAVSRGLLAQLKFVMTECSKTQIRLTGLN